MDGGVLTGYAAVAQLVSLYGFDTVFAMLGGSNVPWIAHGKRARNFRLVKTRHEDAAVSAAAGYARATGRPALCSVTRGPGLTNAVTALIAAVKGHTPVLVITGEASTTALPTQDVDQEQFIRACGAGYFEVDDIAELQQKFLSAVRALHADGRPQVLCVDSRLFAATTSLSAGGSSAFADVSSLRPRASGSDTGIERAAEMLLKARRPLVLAGTGADFAGARSDLVAIAERVGGRLSTTLRANYMFAGHPADLGLCGGWSPPTVREQLRESDVVLAVGASLNDFTTDKGTVFPRADVIHVESDPGMRYESVRPALVIHEDAGNAMRALRAALERHTSGSGGAAQARPWRNEIASAVRAVDLGHDPSRGLDPRDVYITLEGVLPPDRVIVTDVGRFLGTIPSLLTARDSRSWIVGNSYSAIGLGLGLAIGAASAHPERPVVLLTGDGGIAMAAHDLDAVRLNNLNLTIVIIDDELYGSDAKYLDAHGLPRDILAQPLPGIVHLAAAYGGEGLVVHSLEQLQRVDFARPGLRILDVRVDPEVNVRSVIAGWQQQVHSQA